MLGEASFKKDFMSTECGNEELFDFQGELRACAITHLAALVREPALSSSQLFLKPQNI